jgi:glyoxylase-like metal-dependent hydrolase (beta-lactamase superfamily II)
MKVLDRVHQLKIPSPGGVSWDTNVYLLEGDDGHIMVDSGWDSQEALHALQEGTRAANIKLRDIKQLVITHIHPDHYGLSAKMKQICGARVAIHRIDTDLIFPRYKDFTDLVKKMGDMLRQNGVPEDELPQLREASVWMSKYVTAGLPDVKLEEGDKIANDSFELEVLWTPGHSPGHICLYERERRFLLSGDHVLFDATPHVSFNPDSGSNPLGDYVDSLKKLQRLKIHFTLPGHGPVFNALGLRVDGIVAHHEERKRIIMRAMGSGLQTAYAVAQQIPWKAGGGNTSFRDLAVWDRRMAVTETLAHLKMLTVEDRVANIDMDGASLYIAKD